MTIANKLTLARVLVVPVYLILVSIDFPHHMLVAAVLFALACITDILDGYFARKEGKVTNFGKIFDPIADKVLVLSALLPLTVAGRIPFWLTLILETRELLISAIRIQAASCGKQVIAASVLGKWKTTLQDIAIVMMLLEEELPFLFDWYLSNIVLGAAVLMTLWSLGDYFWKNRQIFRET